MVNIYVGNLPYKTTEDELRHLFEQYGEVATAAIITYKDTRRSRGFGFVEMPDEEAAQKAIEALNGFELDGRPLTVNETRPKPERGGRQKRSDRF